MVHVGEIEFALGWIVLFLSLIVLIIFLAYIKKFVPGESKKIFILLTVFLAVYFLNLLSAEGFEIAHFLKLHKEPLTEELGKTADAIAHLLQTIGLGILFYIAILFRNFTKKLRQTK